MKPSQFTHYLLRESGEEYNFLGYGEMLHDTAEPTTVCILSPIISGFAPNPPAGHTRFIICDEDDFAVLFDESSPLGEPVERN